MGRLVRGDPEDELFRRMPSNLSKGSMVAIMKSKGMVKQAGRHLEPTTKGSRAIARIRRRHKGL